MLTFAWNIRDRSLLRLTGWFLVLILFLAGVFLIFRITYPSMLRADATTQRLLVLDAADPAARALIHRAQDKSFGLLPDEHEDGAAEAGFPSFSPSFSGAELHLRPALEQAPSVSKPSFQSDARDLLPPVPRRATLPTVSPARSILRVLPGPELAKRSPAALELPSHIHLTDPAALFIRISVDEKGRVTQIFPLTGIETLSTFTQLRTALSALRFAPAADHQVVHSTLSFRWEAAKPASAP